MQLIDQRLRAIGRFAGNLIFAIPRIQIESSQRIEGHFVLGGRMAQHVPQFTVTAETELAGETNHRRLADVGDVGHLADGQVGRLLDMIPNRLGHGALRRTQRRIHVVDALTYSHRGLHSRAPSRPYFPFLFRGYRLYTGEQSTWIDRNMNGERTLPFTFPLHSLYNQNHGAD